jgi:antitoxin MazE
MIAKIQKWGKSLGLRIPKSLAKQAGLEEGSMVDISLHGNRLVIRRLRVRGHSLRELLDRITEKNLQHEIPSGGAVGREC